MEESLERKGGDAPVSDDVIETIVSIRNGNKRGRPPIPNSKRHVVLIGNELEEQLREIANDFGPDVAFSWIVRKACRMYVHWYHKQRGERAG